jgi:hypothetical protein
MPNPLDTSSTLHLAPWVIFAWGHHASHRALYCRWDCDLTMNGGDPYAACPELAIDSGQMQGGTDDVPFTVTLRTDRYPIYRLLRPYAHAPVTVTVGEVDPYNPDGTYRPVLSGQIRQSTLRGARLVDLTCVGARERMGYPLGLPCLTTCAHHFCDPGCGKDVTPLVQSATITAVSGLKVYAALTRPRLDYFTAGEVYLDGLSLTIAKDGNATYVRVTKPPPPEWVGQSANFIPGCLKTLTACQQWNNESRYLAVGINMPSANPIVEGQANT